MQQEQLFNRDISWLSFNHRVLQEALDENTPLFERIKFLAIYSSNLDEFYRVRVAYLRSFRDLKKKTRKQLDSSIKPKKELKRIRQIVQQQQHEFGQIFRNRVLPALEAQGIRHVDEIAYTATQIQYIRQYYFEKMYPLLQVLYLRKGDEVPFLKNRALYFVTKKRGLEQLAIVEIPTGELPRFIWLPAPTGEYHFTFLDDVLRYFLPNLLDGEIEGAYSVKLSRDAELYIEDEFSGDLLEKLKSSLEQRNIGLPTRFLYDSKMPEVWLQHIKDALYLSKNDLIPGARYHNFNDFFAFDAPINTPVLHDVPQEPLPHPVLETAPSITQCLQEQDVLLHFPYQKYDYIPRWIEEAAADPQVKAIKITLYRLASKSAIVSSLMKALEQGKEVVAFIEAKARFDEASNIYWGDQLTAKGAQVFYSYPGIKVHTKLLLIQRQEAENTRNYAYLGTGNFNEKTARLYADHALMSADKRLTNEVAQVFDLLERKLLIPKAKHLLVSPFTTRQGFVDLVDQEIENAQKGLPAYMILKMNSLEDTGMIEKLYEASQAGVKIQLIVRGICCLKAELAGFSDQIAAISLVDRYLEHARVYLFANGGQEKIFLASADWMTRNMDRRVEVVFPIYSPSLFKELKDLLHIQLRDNTKARRLNAVQDNPYMASELSPVRAQVAIYEYLKTKLLA
ncbi:MAG TPA: polyphosphate kinase 1 [Saprospiraceae bacterium]|nr:polyphosphate kinase 1 [Saprospiraceae bacterium]HMQ85035.1 polyphosphate kinase 1 [Saprospiraceae bacterium]